MTQENRIAIENLKSKNIKKYGDIYGEDVYNIIDDCFDSALFNYMAIKYPSESNRPCIDDICFDFTVCNWINARIKDILDRCGSMSATTYKENGISISYGSSYIDPMLVAMLTPKASVPR